MQLYMRYPQSARRAIRTTNPNFGSLVQHDVVIVKTFVAPRTCKSELEFLEQRAAMCSIVWLFDLKKRYECEEERRMS